MKLFFGAHEDLHRLSLLFHSFGKLMYANLVDVQKRRIQRKKVSLSAAEMADRAPGSVIATVEKQRDAEDLTELSKAFDEFANSPAPSSGEVNPNSDIDAQNCVEQILFFGGSQNLESVAAEALNIRMDKRLQRSNWA